MDNENIDLKEFIPSSDSMLERKIRKSKRIALTYLVLVDFSKNRKRDRITARLLAKEIKKSRSESWQLLSEFEDLGYLKSITQGGSTAFMFLDVLYRERLVEEAKNTLKGDD